MKSHDWRGGASKQFCTNIGCSWMRESPGGNGSWSYRNLAKGITASVEPLCDDGEPRRRKKA